MRRVTDLEKFKFIRKNIFLCKKCFEKNKGASYAKCRPTSRVLIDLAREQLGYKITTYAADIYYSLNKVFEKFRYYFVEGKSLYYKGDVNNGLN